LFLKDDYLNTSRRIRYLQERFGNTPGHDKEARKLAAYARAMKLTRAEISDPEKTLKEWPTPHRLLKRLTGERRHVFEEIYRFWYRSLSALAHHRLTALQAAVFTEEQPNEETFIMAKSVTATLAVSVVLCVLSEIEVFCELPANTPLRAAWEKVRGIDDIIQAVYQKRYGRLLGMSTVAGA
jgi:hypothetical protein